MHRYCLLKAVDPRVVVAEQDLSHRGLGMIKDKQSWV